MVVDKICGKTRKYEIRGLPNILREIADQIEKPDNPHLAVYDAEELKKTLQLFEKKAKCIIKNAYV
jgi:hypothetical protein